MKKRWREGKGHHKLAYLHPHIPQLSVLLLFTRDLRANDSLRLFAGVFVQVQECIPLLVCKCVTASLFPCGVCECVSVYYACLTDCGNACLLACLFACRYLVDGEFRGRPLLAALWMSFNGCDS